MTLKKYHAFLSRARRSPAYWSRIAMRDFTEGLTSRMAGKSRAALAEAAGVSPAYITKVFGGSENFTIETMAKLALAVGGKVRIHIADVEADTRWFDCYTQNAVRTVTAGGVCVRPALTANNSVNAA